MLRKKRVRSWPVDHIVVWSLVMGVLVANGVQAEPPSSGGVSGLTWEWSYGDNGEITEIRGPGDVITRVIHGHIEENGGEVQATTLEFSDEKLVYTQDRLGRLVSAKGPDGTVVFSYDAAGSPVEVRSSDMPTLQYSYDVQGRLIKTRIGDMADIGYRYDYLGRPSAIVTPVGDITYSYHRSENLVLRRLPNGIQSVWKYDDEGKLTTLTHIDADNYIIAKYAYSYRPDNLIKTVKEMTRRKGERTCQYEYDLMQRLSSVKCGKHSYYYQYDLLGNLAESGANDAQTLHFTNTPAGGVESDSRGASEYDRRGHIRKLPHHPTPIDYEFNDSGMLVAARDGSLQYSYNALGLLKERSVKGKRTSYLPDPFADAWHPLWRRNSDGTEAVIVWDGAVPLVEMRGKDVHYRLEDHLGSVRIEADGRGKITAWRNYSPYGVPEDTETNGDLMQAFAGHPWDSIAKVYLTKARAYDPVTARFLQPDPKLRIPDASKHNHSLYAYAGGDPVNFVDHNGAEAVPFNGHAVWWGAYWEDIRRYLFDPQRAKDTLADYSAAHINNARGYGFAAGLTATGLDIIGGYIPGAGGNAGQAYASVAWSLVLGGFSSSDTAFIAALNTTNITRTVSSTVVNIVQGNYLSALLDTVSLGGSVLSSKAGNMVSGAHSIPSGQLEFNFVNKTLANKAKLLKQGADVVNVFGYYRSAYDTYQAGIKGGEKTDVSSSGSLALLTADQGNNGGQTSGIMGASLASSSRPLSPQEYTAWKNSRKKRVDVYDDIDRYFGGGGRGPGPGGGGSRGAGAGYWRGGPNGPGGGSSISMQSPSPVGGVYLGGAGKALEGLGQIKGISIDETTGKLVLIGSNEQKIPLPPLRLDDIVTVFRAVYDHGRSPSVTIDPDEKNPKGPTMDVKHGPGTEGTYVGWILFECDRIMKTYQLGQDNVTKAAISSSVPGYAETLDAVYFGGKAKVAQSQGLLSRLLGINNNPGENWERFWIVPASVSRFDAEAGDLSLFELPLKVNTQKMHWKGGELVDDEDGESSFGANTFTSWFTRHYGEIADEVLLTPPSDTGLKTPVAIFHELRRIAVIAAIAERLRNSGEAMPAWMRDYSVVPFPVSVTTPSLTVKKTKEDGTKIRTANIYGGVNLAPADQDVHIYGDSRRPGSAPIPVEHVAFVNLSKQQAAFLRSKIPGLIGAQNTTGTVQTLRMPDSKALSIAALPGADTRALAPNRQQVADMVVPIGLGRSISLTRHYNSFFDPVGELGSGWTFDLPRMLMTKVPVASDGKRSTSRVVLNLISPLGTVDIRFDKIDRVEPYGTQMYVAEDQPEVAGVASGRSEIVGAKTHQVLFRNGAKWHFDDDGWLVLIQDEGTATRYIRDKKGHVLRVEGYVGSAVVASIKLGYDQQGRIITAKAWQAAPLRMQVPAVVSELEFEYSDNGRLNAVINYGATENKQRQAEWTYSYKANLLSKIVGVDGTNVSFGYSGRGQLRWWQQGVQKIQYTMEESSQGVVLTNRVAGGDERPERWTYDVRMRPVKAETSGGKIVRWQYGQDDEVTETHFQGDALVLTRATSQDGKTETTVLADGPAYEVRRDAVGHPTTLLVDGVLAAEAGWRPDGTFGELRIGNTEITLRRKTKEGWPNGVQISDPGNDREWLEYEWDLMGRPIKIDDSSGLHYVMNYDEQGRIVAYGRLTKEEELMGANIAYNSDGLITDIESSWGKEQREYAGGSVLESIVAERGGAKSVTKFDSQGHKTRQTAFDSGTTTWRYESVKDGERLRAIGLPNGERISYSWDDTGETTLTDVSMGPAVVRTRFDAQGRVRAMTWGQHTSR